MKQYRRLTLEEDLKLSDLTKHQGISALTKPWMKDRQRLFKNKSATLLQMKIDKKKDFIDFKFVSTPTYNPDEAMITKLKSMDLVPSDEYDQTIRFINFFSLLKTNPDFTSLKDITIDEIKEVLWNSNIKVWCDCPSNWYQAFSYYLTQEFDASIHRNDIKPKVWDKRHNYGDGLVCKHLDLILLRMKVYVNNFASMIYKYLRK